MLVVAILDFQIFNFPLNLRSSDSKGETLQFNTVLHTPFELHQLKQITYNNQTKFNNIKTLQKKFIRLVTTQERII